MNSWSPDLFKQAWDFATIFHHGQTYGGVHEGDQIDYLNHVGSVAMEILWALPTAGDVDGDLAVQCALLHDVLEDTAATPDMLLERFGAPVLAGVQALTKDKRLPTKAAQMQDSLARIRRQPQVVWMVKLADRITNLYAPPYTWDNAKILAYQQEARLIYEALHEANAALARRLAEKIAQYPRHLR